jgi:hypothetical protein
VQPFRNKLCTIRKNVLLWYEPRILWDEVNIFTWVWRGNIVTVTYIRKSYLESIPDHSSLSQCFGECSPDRDDGGPDALSPRAHSHCPSRASSSPHRVHGPGFPWHCEPLPMPSECPWWVGDRNPASPSWPHAAGRGGRADDKSTPIPWVLSRHWTLHEGSSEARLNLNPTHPTD